MQSRIVLALALGVSLVAPRASAQPKDKQEIRRDPQGTKGISPYLEEIAKGRTAFQKEDLAAAIAAFDGAIAKDPERLLGYLLKAQAQLAKDDLDGALATAAAGRTKNGTEAEQSKMLFLSAELDERKANTKPGEENVVSALEQLKLKWESVKDAWSRYATFLAEHPAAPDYKASAEERKAKIDARVKRDADYAQVKKRVADNAAEREKQN